jgi:Tol biopolymer transport system component
MPASVVLEKAGEIYYQHADVPPIQLTHTGQNYTPVLSPNEKLIAFVRIGKTAMSERCTHFANTRTANGEQIWVIDIEQHQEKLLVESHYSCNTPTDMIVDPQDLAFSPDSKTLYFTTSAWTTSGALHAVEVNGIDWIMRSIVSVFAQSVA